MTFKILLLLCTAQIAVAVTISDPQALEAGRRLWQNECGGRVDGLTSWNTGEDFASLGIGHFIWYPAGRRGPFEESFPKLIEYFRKTGIALPAWLQRDGSCPWTSRTAFLAEFQGPRLTELRALLSRTVAEQARFAAMRLEAALPLMLESLPAGQQAMVRLRFDSVLGAPGGVYALVDYVNFKGEGIKLTERYNGKGWGLLQVLLAMSGNGNGPDVTREFAAAAGRVLTERVASSPAGRGESRWLPGWLARVRTYRAS